MLRTDLIASVPALLKRQAEARGDQTAYTDASTAVTYGDLDARTARLAGHFQERGVAPGDAIAILLPSSVAWIETCFATLRAGAVSVPISYEATEPEIAYRLADAGCRMIVTDRRAGGPGRSGRLASGRSNSSWSIADRLGPRGRGFPTSPRPRRRERPSIRTTSENRPSSSTRRARPAAPRACSSRSTACSG